MKLHENRQLFEQAIDATVDEFGIYPEFVEKDYWICHILQNLSRMDKDALCVWKGGTSIAKAYGLVNRFSSDVDIALLSEQLSQNQQKKLVAKIGHESTLGLMENENAGTIKNNRFRKTYHSYESVIKNSNGHLNFLGTHVIVEINTYGNPYPYERRRVMSFITEMMQRRGLNEVSVEYDMTPFELNVLDKRRTMCEKIVSLLRFSFSDNPIEGLSSKIRHFYDLHFMSKDKECREYLIGEFPSNLLELIVHDKAEFDRPPQWKNTDLTTSVLFTSFDEIWRKLAPIYKSELGHLTYGELPSPEMIKESVKPLMEYVKKIVRER